MDKEAQRIKAIRRRRQLNRHLRDLTETVTAFLAALDAEMAKPASPERGGRIAALSNRLNLQNDLSRRYGLGEQ